MQRPIRPVITVIIENPIAPMNELLQMNYSSLIKSFIMHLMLSVLNVLYKVDGFINFYLGTTHHVNV